MSSDELLREVETIAQEVDALARTASDDESRGRLSARRQRLLIELDVLGVLDDSTDMRMRLVGLGLHTLVGYRDAVDTLWRYYRCAERIRLVTTPEPARIVDGDISVDWFRVPSGYVPANVPADAWLALCEVNFANPRPTGGGTRWVRLEGRIHRMEFRGEITNAPKLVRVLPE